MDLVPQDISKAIFGLITAKLANILNQNIAYYIFDGWRLIERIKYFGHFISNMPLMLHLPSSFTGRWDTHYNLCFG